MLARTKPILLTRLYVLLVATALVLGLAGRLLYAFGWAPDHLGAGALLAALGRGALFDLTLAAYLSLPFALLGFLPARFWERPALRRTVKTIFFLELAAISTASVAELFFFGEFASRFNFIAVDYLVYTNEVIKNLWESYPLGWVLSALSVALIVLTNLLFRLVRAETPLPYRRQLGFAGLGLAAFLAAFFLVREDRVLNGVASTEGEVSKNAVHALFAAYLNNEIDFRRFYLTKADDRAEREVHEALEEPYVTTKDREPAGEDEQSIVQTIHASGPERRLNVVLVLMESMSARFLQAYGSPQNITPNLDRLAKEGLFFDHVYSTGTRTVRGIEAVTLSVPPTPGQSIVRRPSSDGLFNIGTVFRQKGYDTQFVYGGRALFDNMGGFFAGNGFSVYDQTTMGTDDIHFANAWGVSDEDLFHYAMKQADASHQSGKPFFQLVLTTSNHRPYTFPEGRIDLPSHSGRDGAVKFADYAIGDFLKRAAEKPWYKDTVFVFVADHNASVAGGTKVLPSDYRIPVIFYAPAHLAPRKVSLLGSQIDVAPTLFSALNFSYQSRFFGQDLLHAKRGRAFLGTYQKVGLWQDDQLVLLAPNRGLEVFRMNGEIATPAAEAPASLRSTPAVEETISFYQTASSWYGSGRLKENAPTAAGVNPRHVADPGKPAPSARHVASGATGSRP